MSRKSKSPPKKPARKPKAPPKPEAAPAPPLRLEWRSPSELAENPLNWRRHPEAQIAALTDVIGEVGWAGACLFNEASGRLIDGHARRKVGLDQGADKVPVLVGSWTEEQERKILATLDPLAAMAEADASALDALLKSVSTESAALQGMLDSLAHDNPQPITPGEGGDEFDAAPEAGPTRTQAGDVWLIGGKHRLLVGDCTDAGNVVLLMNGEKAGAVWTDPPYGVNYEGGRNPDSNVPREKLAGDLTGALYEKMLTAWIPYCEPSAPWYIWFADRAGEPVYSAVSASGMKVRAMIVWNKLDAHYGNFMAQYMKKHEPCLYCVNQAPPWNGPTNEVTVWDVKHPSKNEHHPTQKPLELAERAIRNSSDPGTIILDPFLGSGTTLIAAHRLGRVCYGCEIEPKYADVILRRAEAEGLTVEKVGNGEA